MWAERKIQQYRNQNPTLKMDHANTELLYCTKSIRSGSHNHFINNVQIVLCPAKPKSTKQCLRSIWHEQNQQCFFGRIKIYNTKLLVMPMGHPQACTYWEIDALLEEVKFILSNFVACGFKYVHRTANTVADWVVKAAPWSCLYALLVGFSSQEFILTVSRRILVRLALTKIFIYMPMQYYPYFCSYIFNILL